MDECEVCGSRSFFIDSGIRTCVNGHVQAGGQQVTEDKEDLFGTQGKRSRKKVEQAKDKVSKVYRGPKAYKLYLQAYQHILWKQCYALVHVKGCPPELWDLVRDLWTLRLSRLLRKIDQPDLEDDSESKLPSSDPDTGEESDRTTFSTKGYDRRATLSHPVLVEAIALCHLAIMLLKLSISLGDLYRWIKLEHVPYIRAIRYVPTEMIERLPGEYRRHLDTQHILIPGALQKAVYETCIYYNSEFEISMPSLNSSLLLFQYIRRLTLPLEVYAAVKNLNKITDFDIAYYKPSQRRRVVLVPEAQLISLLVIVVKMLFPFDSTTVKRYPYSLNEAAAQLIDWTAWQERRKKDRDSGSGENNLGEGEEIGIKDEDVFKMSDAQLDQYMDWYQKTWSKPTIREGAVNKEILDMFPLKEVPRATNHRNAESELESAEIEVVKGLHSTVKLRRPIPADANMQQPLLRAGIQYTRHRSIEEVSGAAKAFYEAAAEVACLSLQDVLLAVNQTERKIMVWRSARRRAEHFGEEMDLEAEGGLAEQLDAMEGLQLSSGEAAHADEEEKEGEESDVDMELIE